MEEDWEGLGGSGPARVWPVSTITPLREDAGRSSQTLYGTSATLLLLAFFNKCLELCFAADASADLPPPHCFRCCPWRMRRQELGG